MRARATAVTLVLLLLGALSLVFQSRMGAQGNPPGPGRYGYFFHNRWVELKASERLFAVPDAEAAAETRQAGGTKGRFHPLTFRRALRERGLSLLRRLPGEARPRRARSQPVFEQGDSLVVPTEEVLVGVPAGTGIAAVRKLLAPRAARLGLREVLPLRPGAFRVRIADPEDGRAFQVAQSLARVPGLEYAEPNLMLLPAGGGPHDLELPVPEHDRREAVYPLGRPGSAPSARTRSAAPGGVSSRAAPGWTVVLETGFESGLEGWAPAYVASAAEAVPERQPRRVHGGTAAVYMTGGGTEGVPSPGPYPPNCYSVLDSPPLGLSPYEEVYVEFWFYAKYQVPSPGTFFDFGWVEVFDIDSGNWRVLGQLALEHTGNLAADVSTSNGWRRALVRIPPAWNRERVVLRFGFRSDGAFADEGLYIDDVRILGSTDVDSEPLGDDPYAGRQYELRNLGQVAGRGGPENDMRVVDAWNAVQLSRDLLVAVIDDGVDLSHPDLNLTGGYDGDTGSPGGGPRDFAASHGTAVAGNLGARLGNGRGVVGTAPGVRIMPVNRGTDFAHAARAIDLAVGGGARILCNAWGGAGVFSATIETAVKNALQANRVVLFAAGNGPASPPHSHSVAFPASMTEYTDVICVGASSPTDEYKGAASSDGEFWWSSSYVGAGPDVCAPGSWSYTTDRQGGAGYNPDLSHSGIDPDYYHGFWGTSSSTPKVAGIVALMLSKNPTLPPGIVKGILRGTARDIDVPGLDDRTGAGRVDALAAVNAVPVPTYAISGLVTLGGQPLAGVNVSSAGISVTTDESGRYTFPSLVAGSYSVVPQKTGYYFTPSSRSLVLGPSQAGMDFTATADGTLPSAPIDLSVAALSETELRLDWKDTSTNELGFKVEYRTGNEPFVELANLELGPDSTETVLSGQVPGTAYTFRVRAYNGTGASEYSNEATVLMPQEAPKTPARLKARRSGRAAVLLTWLDRSDNESGFKVERKSGKAPFQEVAKPGANTTKLKVTGLARGKTYVFRVRAFNSSWHSKYSNTVRIRVGR